MDKHIPRFVSKALRYIHLNMYCVGPEVQAPSVRLCVHKWVYGRKNVLLESTCVDIALYRFNHLQNP